MAKNLWAVVALLILSLNSHGAAPICEDLFSNVRFVKMAADLQDKELLPFKNTVDSINGFLGELTAPQNISINVHRVIEDPGARPHEGLLKIGLQLGRELGPSRTYTKNPTFSQAILAHEYGHLIFRENFIRIEPKMREAEAVFPQTLEPRKKVDTLDAELDLLRKQLPTLSWDEKSVVWKRMHELETEKNQLIAQVMELMQIPTKLNERLDPYDEFFADVVAVLQTENPSAVSEATKFTILQQKVGKPKLLKFSDDSRDFQNKIQRPLYYGKHEYFLTVRAHLWNSYLASQSLLHGSKAKILSAVYAAVAKEAQLSIAAPSFGPQESWKELNQNLIQRLDAELTARGIKSLK